MNALAYRRCKGFSVLRFLFIGFLIGLSGYKLTLNGQNLAEINAEETGIWAGIYLRGQFSKRLGYYGEHHYRARNSLENINSFVGRNRQIYNRFGLSMQFSKYFEVIVGPTLVLNFTPEPNNPDFASVTLEPRIWHQWLLGMPDLGRLKIYHQFRFEHRWKRANDIDADFKFTNRYRYKIFAYYPINKKKITDKTLYISPSAEIFMQTGSSIGMNPFEDFRIYNGIGYVLNRNVTFFGGHMWTIGQRSSGFQYRTSHVIRLNVFFSIDFRSIDDKMPPINLGY